MLKGQNILPKDGTVFYRPALFSAEESKAFFNVLLETIEWRNDEVFLFGKHHITKRKVAWYGEGNFSYTYSNKTKVANPWSSELKNIKERVENVCALKFNSCLLNLYHDGSEGMGWHSDDEKTLGQDPAIASVSFGVPRKFYFRHKTDNEKVSLLLDDGSLILMKDETQHHWLHSLPKAKRIILPRINLTFRNFIG